jgi:hypothetical protein
MSMSFSLSSFAKRRRAHGSGARARRGRMTRQPIIEGLEGRICLTTDVWTGGAASAGLTPAIGPTANPRVARTSFSRSPVLPHLSRRQRS